jgi:uncharacterized membrane protein
MPIEYKVSIIFIIVGILNFLLRNNRNWIFGYRSPRAIKTHLRFAYANTYYGIGMFLAGIFYFVFLNFFENLSNDFSGFEHAFSLIIYFILLFILIEFRLSRTFKN